MTLRDYYAGRLPDRYQHRLEDALLERLGEVVQPGQIVLDVGAGRSPTLVPEARPAGLKYVGLDLSKDEIEAAGAGAYDEAVVGDIVQHDGSLDDRFDVVVSFQVLEHVRPLAAAIENMYRYLQPGGVLLAQMSGAFTAAAVVNRVIPGALSRRILAGLTGRRPETVFPAHYDHCWNGALEAIAQHVAPEAAATVTPIWLGAGYTLRRPLLRPFAIGYEEWTRRHDFRNLAPYYLLEMAKPRPHTA